mgnify:CR=1 FL=1
MLKIMPITGKIEEIAKVETLILEAFSPEEHQKKMLFAENPFQHKVNL